MLAVKQLSLFLLFATSALAQSSTYAYDCSKLSPASPGCKSYNEMVIANDKQLLSIFQTENIAFVCFRPYQDVFFTLSYAQPTYEEFTRVGSTTTYQTPGLLYYVRYKDGVRDDMQFVLGSWKKYTKDGGQPAQFFPTQNSVGPKGNISADEVGIEYTFSNLSNTKTAYNVAIRRSTLRYVENYMWENPPEKSKKTKAADQSQQSEPTKGSEDITGYCASFSLPLKP
jgi:hypothetical protein